MVIFYWRLTFQEIFSILTGSIFTSDYYFMRFPDNLEKIEAVWDVLSTYSNMIIFTLSGVIIIENISFSIIKKKFLKI